MSAEWQFLIALNEQLRPLRDPVQAQEMVLRLLGEHLGDCNINYAVIDGDEFTIACSYTTDVPPFVTRGTIAMFGTAIPEAARRGETVVVEDIATDTRLPEADRELIRAAHLSAMVGVPLIKDGRWVATLGVQSATPRRWTANQIHLIQITADRLWSARERARTEEAHRRAEAELHANHERLRFALEASGGGLWSLDLTTNQAFWDERFRQLYGFTADEPARGEKWLARVHEEDRPRLLAAQEAQFSSASGATWEYTFRIVTPDGAVRWIQSRGRTDHDAEGRTLRLTGLDLDFDRHAAALRARTIELEQRTTQLSRMASDVTLAEQHAREQIAKTLHDGLQQLLVIASTNLDRQAQRDAERGAAPSELLSSARGHLNEAIAAARSLSIELFPPVLQHSGLPAALQWLAGWIRDKYGLEVVAEVDARADSARKDIRTLIFESVRELLFNAVKHAHAPRVSLALALDDRDQLWITVEDHGVGFDAAQLDNRTKAGQGGWGLFSIRERLTLLGGRFEIESAPGVGTTVRLIAPRGIAPSAPASGEVGGARPGPVTSEVPDTAADALRILIVDDHAPMRTALREILQERPQLSVVGEAADGLEAIGSAHRLRPDVILMDASMPLMDGIEATLRIHAELPGVTILGLSMHAGREFSQAFALAGAADFFVKGTDTQRLLEHLLRVHAAGAKIAGP